MDYTYEMFWKRITLDDGYVPSLLKVLLVTGGAIFLLVFLGTAIARMGYPYELEWMEGGAVDHVRRVLDGQPIYIRPSLAFTPFIYTPLYYYISAVFSLLTSSGLFALRLVSFLSSLGCFSLIHLLVQRETGESMMGVLSASLFAASYVIGGTWFDLARTDMLFLFLLLAGIYVLRLSDSVLPIVLAGLLFSLSFFAKQTALMVVVSMGIYTLLVEKGRRKLVFLGTVLVLVGIPSLVWNAASDGWFAYYIFDLPAQHQIHWDMLPSILIDDIGLHLPVASGLSIIFILTLLMKRRCKDFLFFGFLFGGLFGAACFSRMHSGGYLNVLIPGFAALAITFGLGIHALLSWFRDIGGENAWGIWLRRSAATILLLMCMWQFWNLRYDPRILIPTAEARAAGEAFVERVKGIEGEVFIPYHGYLSTLAGKQTYSQGMAMEDVFRATNEEIRDAYKAEIRTAIEEKRFGAIILDGEWRFVHEIEKNYELVEVLDERQSASTYTGMPTRPHQIYMPRE